MSRHLRCYLHLLVICFWFSPVAAQSLDPTTLKTPDEHRAFLDQIGALELELPGRESGVLLKYGYKSPEHLALRDSIRLRNDTLRLVVDRYLDLYGFPTRNEHDLTRLKMAQTELVEEIKRIPVSDSIAMDSIVKAVRARYPRSVTVRNLSRVVLRVLETEPDFNRRCEMISLLRFEFEQENISLASTLIFLRHTYQIQYRQELGIVSGTTERERLMMYARELSGCWGN